MYSVALEKSTKSTHSQYQEPVENSLLWRLQGQQPGCDGYGVTKVGRGWRCKDTWALRYFKNFLTLPFYAYFVLVWGTLAHLTESVLRECVPVLQTVCAPHPTNHCVETLAFKCWGFAKRLGHEGGVLINRINTNKKKVRDSHVHSFGHVRTHQTDPYEPRSRLTPDTKCQLFELGLPNLWNGEKYVSLLCKPTQFVGFFL